MKMLSLAASAALALSATLYAQVVGQTPTPPAIDGEAPASTVYMPQYVPGTVPQAWANTYGTGNNNIPFSWQPTRYQQIFLGTELPQALVIRGLGLRFDEAFSGYKGQTVELEIKLGYTTKSHSTMSSTFASNFDVTTPPPVTVYKRQKFQLPDMGPNKPTNPQLWQVQIPFDVPFVWARQQNYNICIEVVNWGNSNNNTNFTYPLDYASSTTTTRLYASGAPTATTGTLGTGSGHVMCFLPKVKTTASFITYGKGCPGTGGTPQVALPAAASTQMGNSNNYYGVGKSNMRYQQLFDAADVGPARVFQGHALRFRSTYTGGPQTLEVKMCATTNSPASASATFASNITSTQTVVFAQKSYNYPNMVANTDPSSWMIPFKWDKPFIWTAPSGQHLLMEILNSSSSDLSYFPDAFSGATHSVTRIYSTSGTTAATGTVGTNYGLAMALRYAGGGNATPMLGSTATPIINTSLPIDLSMARANTAAILIFGFSNTTWGAIPLPLDLAGLGANGCNLLASPDIFFPGATDANGDASMSLPIPNDSNLSGAQFHTQFMVLDPSANSAGLVFTNGGTATIGEQ